MTVKYRPEIDGLRAVAVLSVIFYHAHLPGFGGGYVGVDSFFVISGYLISSIILSDLRAGTYSIVGFYERRIRRIFPPLFATLAASFATACFLLLPRELEAFAESLFQTGLFASNLGFWAEAGYFDQASELKPLLHTWSLAVEEQFYLVFPPLLTLIWRRKRSWLPWVLCATIMTSLAWSEWAARTDAESAFYLVHLRAWELLIGVLLAVLPAHAASSTRRALESATGLALIALATTRLDGTFNFPGLSALLPTLGTALVIRGESPGLTPVGRLLGLRPLVAVGLVSYALYLWHWPILVFGRMITVRPLRGYEVVAALTLTALLAVASRYWLELPVRSRRVLTTRRSLFAFAASGTAACGVLALVLLQNHGLPGRIPPPVAALLKVEADAPTATKSLRKVCLGKLVTSRTWLHCDVGDAKRKQPSLLVWGDSHAAALGPVVDAAARSLHERGTVAFMNGCAPLIGVHRRKPKICVDFETEMRRVIQSNPRYHQVVLLARWGIARGRFFHDPQRPAGVIADTITGEQAPATDIAAVDRLVDRGLMRTLDFLQAQHRETIIMGPIPELRYPAITNLARQLWLGGQVDLRTNTADFVAWNTDLLRTLKAADTRPGVTVVYPHETLCETDRCDLMHKGRSLYRDDNHLTAAAAPLLGPQLARALRSAAASRATGTL